MSDWTLRQWMDQLKATDEASKQEAAAMLGQEGDPRGVPALLKAAVREAHFWAVTDFGEPKEPDHRPLCRTANESIDALSVQHLLQAHADLKAWRKWKETPASKRKGEAPDWKGSGLGRLLAGLANDENGRFDAPSSAAAAWSLGEAGFHLIDWSGYLGYEMDWDWFLSLPRLKQEELSPEISRGLVEFMAESGLGREDARKTLLELHEDVGRELIEMLQALGERRRLGEPSDLSRVQRQLVAALGRMRYEPSAAAIREILQESGWPELRWDCALALGLLKDKSAVGALVPLMDDEHPASLRAQAARALGEISDRNAARGLLQRLNDSSSAVRLQAVRALGRLAVPQTKDRLFQAMLDEDDMVRFAVGTALGLLGDARTVPFLLHAIREGDQGVQTEAETALQKLGKNALTSLVQILRSGVAPYRADAAVRLGDLQDPRAIRYLVPALLLEDCQKEVAEALVKMGAASVEPLLAYLKATDDDEELENVTPALQEQVIRVLGRLGDKRAAPPLIAALSAPETDLRVQEEAARVLGKLGDPAASAALIGALDQRRPDRIHVRAEAARSLGLLRDTRAVKTLIEAMREGDEKLRNYAIDALGELGDKAAVEPLIEELRSFRRGGRAGVIQALGRLKDDRAAEPLMDVVTERPRTYLNALALQALARLGDPGVIPLILEERDWHQELTGVLRLLGARALEPLHEALRSGSTAQVRAVAALALGDIASERSMGALIQALQDPVEEVQKAATRSLARVHASAQPTLRLTAN